MMTKIAVFVASLGFVLALATPAAANVVAFNPSGTGGGGCTNFGPTCFLIDVMDPTVGNAISVGLKSSSPVGAIGTLLFQANLGLTSVGGTPNYLNGFGGNFFTFVAGLSESISSKTGGGVNPTTLNFGFAPGANFFNIYRNSQIGNNLSGACFAGADTGGTPTPGGVCSTSGTLILSGVFVNDATFSGSFTADQNQTGGALDQFGTNNYDGTGGSDNIHTITGGGSFKTNIRILSANPGYFPGLLTGSQFIFATSQQTLPFGTTDPSYCFSSNGLAGCGQPGAQIVSVGTINGLSGSNTMLQTDASLSFQPGPPSVPEPATLSLLGLGLLGSVAARRRQLRKKQQ